MKKIYCLLLLLFAFFCKAQNPGDVAQTFGSFLGNNGYINSIAMHADGKIIIAGYFTKFNSVSENSIICLNADGTRDNSFNITGTGFNSPINRIALQSDGKILAFGYFTAYNDETVNGIIRLNANGTRDTSFNTGTGFNFLSFTLGSIAVQSDGKILIGGNFTSYNGITVNKIIRLNADGTKDTSFNGPEFSSFVIVHSIALQNDGKILVGANNLFRLNADGTVDNSFSTGGVNGSIFSIVVQTDGKILAGGNFNSVNGLPRNRIVRLNANGSMDNSFNPGTGFNLRVNSIALTTDDKIIVGGDFTSYNGVTENRIICLNTNGTKDGSFNTGTGFNNSVNSIVVQSDGKILVGGSFTSYDGSVESKFISLNANGTKNTSFPSFLGPGFNSSIFHIAVQSDGKALVCGDFTSYNGLIENRIIRLNTDGTKDNSFNSESGFNGNPSSIIVQSDGKILVGGVFTSFNGITEGRIIRLNTDGTKDTSFTTGTGFNFSVTSMALQNDGKVLVSGPFTLYNGVTENSIIRLNANGTKDTSFNPGTGFIQTDFIYSIVVQTDGKILVGGNITSYNGVTESLIIRLNADGSKDTSFSTGSGFNNVVYGVNSIALQTDSKILVGGFFNTYNGVTENNIIRLNADGTKDTSFNSGTGFNDGVMTISLATDDKIIVGGDFTSYNGVTENRIIRLNPNGTKDTSFNTGTGFNDRVYKIVQQTNDKILVGGNFYTYKDDNSSNFLISLYTNDNLSSPSFTTPNDFTLWPNPVQDILHIDTIETTTVSSIALYNLQGKLLNENVYNNVNVINVSDLPVGLYLIKIQTENGEFTRKFIKE